MTGYTPRHARRQRHPGLPRPAPARVGGLTAWREQGITIEVACRFFATAARKFIVADTPGHEQCARNMVTGASTAEPAVILTVARKGVLTQTRRHSFLAQLLGIRRIVLAVNKIDPVGHDRATYDATVAEYRAFAAGIGIAVGHDPDLVLSRRQHCCRQRARAGLPPG